jgi:hypothetical protein
MTARSHGKRGMALAVLLLTVGVSTARGAVEPPSQPSYVRTTVQAEVYRSPAHTAAQIGFIRVGVRCRVMKAVRVGKDVWYLVKWDQGGVSYVKRYDGSGSGSGYVRGSSTDRPELPGEAHLAKGAPALEASAPPGENAVSALRPAAKFGTRYRVVEERYEAAKREYVWLLESTEEYTEAPLFTGVFQDSAGVAIQKTGVRFDPASGYTAKGKRVRATLPYPNELTLARVRRVVVEKPGI